MQGSDPDEVNDVYEEFFLLLLLPEAGDSKMAVFGTADVV